MLSNQFVEPMALCMLLILVPLCLQVVPNVMRQYRLARAMGCKSAKSRASLKDPYIGIDFIYNHLFKRAPATYMDKANRSFLQLGSTYTSKRWTWETIYTCDHRNIKQILATGFDDFELPWVRVGAMSSLLGQGIFTLNGKSWAHARSILKPSLTKSNMDHLNDIIEKHFQAFLQFLPSDESQVDLQPLFFGLAMDIATGFLMNHSTRMLDPSKQHEREERFIDDYMICSEKVSQRMQMGPLQIFAFSAKASRARKRVFKYVDDYVEECLQEKGQDNESKRYNVLQELTKATGSRETLRDQMLHILLASRDTTASLLSNLFFLLAKNPAVYAKLRDDVLNVAGTECPTAEQLKEMRYLKWCVQECELHLFLHKKPRITLNSTTSAPSNPHKCTRSSEGYNLTSRRRRGWFITFIYQEGHNSCLQCVLHAS